MFNMELLFRINGFVYSYKYFLIAKSLKSGKTNTIGLILADISNPFFSNIARIIENEAKRMVTQ